MNDIQLQAEIRRLRKGIRDWALAHQLWDECSFASFTKFVDAEPSDEPAVSVLRCGDTLIQAMQQPYSKALHGLIHDMGYWCEFWDEKTIALISRKPELNSQFADYFRWKWICSLIKPDFDDIFHELFEHFSQRPEDFSRLAWRKFEFLVAAVLENQGFKVDVGPGSNDGGVDIRLLQRDPLGDILTLVQVKRRSPKYEVSLEAVSALHGVTAAEEASNSFFVTSSYYSGSAKRFAARENVPMTLFVSEDVQEWCRQANNGIISDKSQLVSATEMRDCLERARCNSKRWVLHSVSHAGGITNYFALVIRESKHAAILMSLPGKTLVSDRHGIRGEEVPNLSMDAVSRYVGKSVWRAKKKRDKGGLFYWDGRHKFIRWIGERVEFLHD